jgi:hypothetical protein
VSSTRTLNLQNVEQEQVVINLTAESFKEKEMIKLPCTSNELYSGDSIFHISLCREIFRLSRSV